MTKTLQPPSDPYERQTYDVLMLRGLPHAEALEKARFWGALKRSDPTGETVIGPADNPFAKIEAKQGAPRIETDQATGRRQYKGSYGASTAYGVTSGPVGAPPSIIEPPPDWTNIRTAIDRYAANPLVDYYRSRLPGAEFGGPEPQLFLHGPLPVVTSSGVDPSVLRWVPFWARHEAAAAGDMGTVYALIEGAETPSIGMYSLGGRAGWEDYVSRVSSWVNSLPPPPDLTEADYSSFYPDDTSQ